MNTLLPILLLFSYCAGSEISEMKLKTFVSNQSTLNQDLLLEENLHGGRFLKLNNGTIWEVAPQDLQITEIWIFPFPLNLEKSNNPTYPYYLVNLRSKTKVLVRPLSREAQQQVELPTPTYPQPKPLDH